MGRGRQVFPHLGAVRYCEDEWTWNSVDQKLLETIDCLLGGDVQQKLI